MSGFLNKMKHFIMEDDPNAANTASATTPVVAQPQPTNRPIAGIPGISVDGNIQTVPDDNLTQTYVGKLREKFAT